MNLMRIHPYTLVIMDILLSHTNVREFITEVRCMNPTPILALSEQASTADKVLALQCGAYDYLLRSTGDCRYSAIACCRFMENPAVCSLSRGTPHVLIFVPINQNMEESTMINYKDSVELLGLKQKFAALSM